MPIVKTRLRVPQWLTIPTSRSSTTANGVRPTRLRRSNPLFGQAGLSEDDDAFWQSPARSRKWTACHYEMLRLHCVFRFIRRRPWTACLIFLTAASLFLMLPANVRYKDRFQEARLISTYEPLRPVLHPTIKQYPNPTTWLKKHFNSGQRSPSHNRPRAAIISLVRNSELKGIAQSMTQLEYRWNWLHNYPWIFFNDEPFTEEFKTATRNLTSSVVYFELVPKEHWSMPEWIDSSRFENSLEYLGTIGVGKGWMESYHHMCRWNAGFFYKHPRLKDFDWYWRVEPDVNFFCDINYDVFQFMSQNQLTYGFNIAILDDARSFPSLWTKTRAFIAENPDLIHPEADLAWLLGPDNLYNNCQFFSNFEIGSLSFWRSEAVEAYFNYLDASGGFYYERWGDAPVHTLAVAMFTPKRQHWWFRDIGYQHSVNSHCPPGREGSCACEKTSIDQSFYKLVPDRSRQKKPVDTCIRAWLGGVWTEKRPGWTAEIERAWGGDGYGGYVRWE